MTTTAAYDAYADWYEDYVTGAAAEYTARRQALLRRLLGAGHGVCLDVCCGTGVQADELRALGWRPVGLDLSGGQLRHAVRRLPVVRADAAVLPFADGAVSAVDCVLASTDVPDYAAVLREVARVLQPGGRFVHIGVHPCYVGAFADWSARPAVVVNERYADRSHSYDAWSPAGVRARVGAWHVPLADLLNAVVTAGLRLERVEEIGPGGVPDVLGLAAVKPA
ncbi:class I SAM-dependent methyltransferase [Dactylosporangium sp. NPDC051485]|uniref:class I SAM-dependent methyltransferase n=1 Tax=Dactylosporangium sp. NPDC051485 TaxID=3154846 RepID=UPI003426E8D6